MSILTFSKLVRALLLHKTAHYHRVFHYLQYQHHIQPPQQKEHPKTHSLRSICLGTRGVLSRGRGGGSGEMQTEKLCNSVNGTTVFVDFSRRFDRCAPPLQVLPRVLPFFCCQITLKRGC